MAASTEKGEITIKLSDFGMSRFLDRNYYNSEDDQPFAVRWSPPEGTCSILFRPIIFLLFLIYFIIK